MHGSGDDKLLETRASSSSVFTWQKQTLGRKNQMKNNQIKEIILHDVTPTPSVIIWNVNKLVMRVYSVACVNSKWIDCLNMMSEFNKKDFFSFSTEKKKYWNFFIEKHNAKWKERIVVISLAWDVVGGNSLISKFHSLIVIFIFAIPFSPKRVEPSFV